MTLSHNLGKDMIGFFQNSEISFDFCDTLVTSSYNIILLLDRSKTKTEQNNKYSIV